MNEKKRMEEMEDQKQDTSAKNCNRKPSERELALRDRRHMRIFAPDATIIQNPIGRRCNDFSARKCYIG